jgi:membrane-associated protease RseP (regulator of RpoE activity)
MIHRFLLCVFVVALAAGAHAEERSAEANGENWSWGVGSEDAGGGSSYLGVDIADVSPERLGELKLKEEHGAEITMVDQDAPAGKAGLHEHDVIVSLNGTAVESAAQLRRMIKETPAGRVVSLGISRDGQPQTIKVQLADRHKSMTWEPQVHVEIPRMPDMPSIPDFDLPVSVVVVHSGLRSGLMLENITPQLGEFFGVKDGKGVLVRSVEKGGRGDKAGFRAGDVVVKVNNQPVHDTSDFTHALRSSSRGTAAVTVMREKKEQNLTLTLPDKKDSGRLVEDSLEIPEFTAEAEQAIDLAKDNVALLAPAIAGRADQAANRRKAMEDSLREGQEEVRQQMLEQQEEIKEQDKARQDETKDEINEQMKERQEDIRERDEEIQQKVRQGFRGTRAEI